jgi:hypothetical protein
MPVKLPLWRIPVLGSAWIAPGSVTTDKLADGAVTTPKLADGAVTPAKTANLGVLRVWTASPSPGTGGAYGAAVSMVPSANKAMVPLWVRLSWGGTFATAETVTIRLTAYFSDGTTATLTKSATAAGDYWLTDAEKTLLWKDGVYITRIDVDSASSASSTSVTTSVAIYGLEL